MKSNLFTDKLGRSKIPLAKSKLFWIGLLIKLTLSCLFASSYMRDLFAPFGNYFIASGFDNPYDHFLQNGQGNEFPYPPLMLLIFTLPRMLFWPLTGGSAEAFGLADALLYRVPLLLADFVILLVLIRWLKTHTQKVIIWYWLSPVLIYISYFHGQLDVIPMALLMVSLYFLFKRKWILSSLFIAMAVGTKTNMVLVLPFSILYMFRSSGNDLKISFLSVAIILAVLFLINLPYLNSQGMLSMVYDNPVQRQILDFYYQFNSNLRIYFIPSVYFILVLYYMSFNFVNRDQLVLFLAFTFLALTLMIAPMQGWYYWIFPLLVYFIVKQDVKERFVFILLSFFYFVYFGLIGNSDYLNSGLFFLNGPRETAVNETLLNIAFTLLQTTLVLIGFLVFRNGIFNNIQTKFLSQPYLIGIGGDSASGKSTLSNSLSAVFEGANTSIVRGDDMHKWERGNENWKTYTHLDPKANNIHQDVQDAKELKSGKSIKRRNYDHNTGKFTLPQFIKTNKLVVFEGLHSFYLNNQVNVYDLKIFMEPDETLRMWWKVSRDVKKRGYTPETVLEQIKIREEDSIRYIRTQADNADIVARFFSLNEIDPVLQETEPEIGLELTVSNDLFLEDLLKKLGETGEIQYEHSYEESRQTIVLKGRIAKEKIEFIADRCIPELEDIGIYNSEWKEDYEGLLQLFITFIIFSTISRN